MDPIDTPDLFAFEEETLGGLEDEFGPSRFILLRNFELNSDALKLAHLDILRERVVPFVNRSPGFAEIYGMTDRSGSRQINYRVGANRLEAVQRQMMALGAPQAKVVHAFAKSIGEDFFEDRHDREKGDLFFTDGLRKGELRVVVIALTPAPIGVPTRAFRRGSAADTVNFCRRHTQRH
jgi:hypothetical protein